MSSIIPIPRTLNPYPRTGVDVGERGPRYVELTSSLVALLRSRVEQTPDVEAVVEIGGERFTYLELWERAARVSGGLRDLGITKGDRVAIRYPAGITWVTAFWGTLMAGAIAVATNTRSSESEVAFMLEDAGVKLDLAADSDLPSGAAHVDDHLTGDDVAAFFYTSGTTGHPKAVPTTHTAFLTNAVNVSTTIGIPANAGAGMRTLISVPLFHVTGCNTQLLAAVYVGGTSVILPAFNQSQLLQTLQEERITFMVSVPAIYSLILRNKEFDGIDVSRVRWVGYGGAPVAPSLVAQIQKGFPDARVFNGYGMTESASLMTVLPHEDAVEHADSIGYAVPSIDLGVIPLNDDEPMVGELVARGANVTAGYWNRPEANAETFAGGWLHTGDIVRVDDAGRVHIIDRSKDIIIRGGENISSLEVEAALLGAPGVTEAAAIAVPDDVMGEKVGVVLYSDSGEIVVDDVIAHCRVQLADYKVPQYVQVLHQPLPRNAGGKLLKAKLRHSAQWDALAR
ncbi:class I adenylate-forming enzyme family protein [Nakamurella sp.]|uniref:class I adenylate-forming enzyme family protein n=1 Tax=Nakamurella sp. TaxID=1869182 RepID=UPI0037845ED4